MTFMNRLVTSTADIFRTSTWHTIHEATYNNVLFGHRISLNNRLKSGVVITTCFTSTNKKCMVFTGQSNNHSGALVWGVNPHSLFGTQKFYFFLNMGVCVGGGGEKQVAHPHAVCKVFSTLI